MDPARQCPQCGAPLNPVDGGEVCPGCLLEAGLGRSYPDGPDQAEPSDREAGPAPTELPFGIGEPRSFGDYELQEEIARGGMGVVYRARQKSLDRLVAVKVMLFGRHADSDLIRRFKTEAVAAGALHHPHIVAIHDVGMQASQPFLVMDYVDGPNLANLVKGGSLPARRAAGYLRTIAEAIHFAHEHGVLHRDLKPSNVLIDARDRPRVTDFGLARRLDVDSSLTATGQLLGTPNFMPPEQVTASPARITRRCDVYGLGAVLYYLLTGRPPFQGESLEATLHQVLTAEPVSPRLLNAGVPLDLETICLKCLEKEPARRYATAQDVADELARFLHDEPIRARPVTGPERLWRWARRKPALATLIVLVHLVAAVGLAGIVSQWRRAEQNAAEARTQRDVAEGRSYAGQMRLAHADYRAGRPGIARQRLDAWIEPKPGRPDWRGFEWRWLQRLCAASVGEVIATNTGGFTAVAASPDGRRVALGAMDGTIQLLDAHTGARGTSWLAHPGGISGLGFISGENDWLVTVGGDDQLLKIWDSQGPRLLATTNCSKGLLAHVTVGSSGRRLTAGAADGPSVNVWELARDPSGGPPRLVLKLHGDGHGPSALSPGEDSVAIANYWDFKLAILDLNSGAPREVHQPSPNAFARTIAFSPDGRWLASYTTGHRRVLLWPVDRSSGEARVLELGAEARALTFSADGNSLFAATLDGNLGVWDLAVSDPPVLLPGHRDAVNGLAFLGREPVLISASRDGTARRWQTDAAALARASQPPSEFEVLSPAVDRQVGLALAVAPDQRHLAVVSYGEVRVFDLLTGRLEATIDSFRAFGAPDCGAFAIAYSPDGTHLALGGLGGSVTLIHATTWEPVRKTLQAFKPEVSNLRFALGGRALVVSAAGFSGEVAIVDVADWQVTRRLQAAGNLPGEAIAVNEDGTRLALAARTHRLTIHEIESGRVVAECPQPVRFVTAVAFSPDARSVAFTDDAGAVHLWDLDSHRPLRRWTGHRGEVLALAFSPDGRTLASGGMDFTVRLWHPDLDQETAILTSHPSVIFGLGFALHGEALASVSLHGGAVLVWRAASTEITTRAIAPGRLGPLAESH